MDRFWALTFPDTPDPIRSCFYLGRMHPSGMFRALQMIAFVLKIIRLLKFGDCFSVAANRGRSSLDM